MQSVRQCRTVDRLASSKIPPEFRVKGIKQLREMLQSAIKLEHSTIPPYLCALYSIRDGKNQAAVDAILSVVMEEMLHMALAANVLIAIGGKPAVNQHDFIPKYPLRLDFLNGRPVNLERFCQNSIDTFIEIERPDDDPVECHPQKNCWEHEKFKSIGQFYQLIELGLKELSQKGDIFTGASRPQIDPVEYYGGGGELTRVTDLESALRSLKEIVDQGEGIPESIWEEPNPNPQRQAYLEVAHFYRFIEIRLEKKFVGNEPIHLEQGQKYPLPTGAKVAVDWSDSAVLPMAVNPRMDQLQAYPEYWKKSKAFNIVYSQLLDGLHSAMNGHPEEMSKSTRLMHALKDRAVELMNIPHPDDKTFPGQTIGPSFEYILPADRK